MIKKIGMWTVYAVVVGLLIFGGINRTLAKADQDEGRNAGTFDETATNQSRGGEGKNEQLARDEDEEHEASLDKGDWIELTGTITEFDASYLWIQLEGGDILEVEGRSWRFAQESGYQPMIGNEIELTGFYENGEFELSRIRDLSSGENVLLRDETGRPLWSGGRRN